MHGNSGRLDYETYVGIGELYWEKLFSLTSEDSRDTFLSHDQ